MATFKFVLRPSTKAGRHPGSLSLRVVHNRKPKTVSLAHRLFPEEWDEVRQTILYPADNPARAECLQVIERYISTLTERANDILRKLEKKGGCYTAGEIIVLLHHWTDETHLTGYAAFLSEELFERGQFRTAKAYATVCRGLVRFNNNIDIPLIEINTTLIKAFECYLKENGKQPNTISYYMRNLRAIYNKAINAGRIPQGEKPFANVFTGVEETRKRALTADEVNRLKDIDFDRLLEEHRSNARQQAHLQNLERARRLFFFCLYAQGMCFVDLCSLKKSNLQKDVIRYYRRKTGRQIEVPVNEGMRSIIGSFAREMADSDYLFPLLKEDRRQPNRPYETALRAQNRRLKRLGQLAGLEKGLTTHVARHSWASILKNKMHPLSVISEGLGHASEKMTRKYLASFDRSILVDAGKAMLTAVSLPSGLSTRLL